MERSTLDVQRLSVSYKKLVLWFGAQLLLIIPGAVADVVLGESPLGLAVALVRLVAGIVTMVALVLYAYRTAKALGSRVSALWGVAMIIPLVNLITLLSLSAKATRACRAAGIPVGLFGPKTNVAASPGDPR